MIILMHGLVALSVWYGVMVLLVATCAMVAFNPLTFGRSVLTEIVGFVTLGILAIETALLIGAIWI
jgi:hypothetical protein